MTDHAPMISLAQVEFELAAKQWQEQAAYAALEAARYTALAHQLATIYRYIINSEK